MMRGKSELYTALEGCRTSFIATGVFSFFINMLIMVVPLYMLQVFDRVLSSRSEETLLMLTLIAGFLLLTLGVLDGVRARVLIRAGLKLEDVLKGRVFGAVFERGVRDPEGGHTQALQDLDRLRQFLTGSGLIALLDAPWVPFFVAIIFLLHPWLGILSVIGSLLLFSLALINELTTRDPLQEANHQAIKATQFAEASLKNAEVLKAMGMLPGIRERWYAKRGQVMGLQALASDRASAVMGTTKFVRLFLQVGALGIGAYLVIYQTITPGAMIAASVLLSRALAPVEQAVGNWRTFVAARSAYGRLQHLLDSVPSEVVPMALPKPKGQLSVDQIVVTAPGPRSTAHILKRVTFDLAPGEILGVIGPTAGGKSTLARTLVGVWPVTGGSVRLDGADISEWNSIELGRHLGYLPQNVELFDGTIAENIARFDKIDPDKVIAVAVQAGVHDMILGMPQGYDTPIGEGGRALSGGQAQRIGLARALYGDPSLIVLDEPNSSLDGDGERALIKLIANLKAAGKTVVIIAHRPSILKGVDKILALQNGMVKAFGPPTEVMAQFISSMPGEKPSGKV
jgi:PrtD family type I secretion system ABC transporter